MKKTVEKAKILGKARKALLRIGKHCRPSRYSLSNQDGGGVERCIDLVYPEDRLIRSRGVMTGHKHEDLCV